MLPPSLTNTFTTRALSNMGELFQLFWGCAYGVESQQFAVSKWLTDFPTCMSLTGSETKLLRLKHSLNYHTLTFTLIAYNHHPSHTHPLHTLPPPSHCLCHNVLFRNDWRGPREQRGDASGVWKVPSTHHPYSTLSHHTVTSLSLIYNIISFY